MIMIYHVSYSRNHLYSSRARAWENDDMAGFEPYTWNDYEQGKLARIRGFWSEPTV